MTELGPQVVGVIVAAMVGGISAIGVKFLDRGKTEAEQEATVAGTYQAALTGLRDEMVRREQDFERRIEQIQQAHEQALKRERQECDRRITALEAKVAALERKRG